MKAPLKAAAVLSVCFLATLFLPDAPTPLPEYGESDYTERPQGSPDQFLQYHRDIRTSVDGVMGYSVGYRLTEHQKAVANAKTSTALNWVERGPANAGGRTRSLVMDPDDPTMRTWWAGSVSGGLWKTSDGGASWEPLTDHLPILAIGCLVMASSDHDVMYMGTGEGFGGVTYVDGDGIFKSTDRGDTWIHLPSTIANKDFRYVNRLAVDPMDADVVLAATGAGIFRSTDGGDSWAQTYEARTSIEDLRAQPGNFNRLIASENARSIIYSDDAGLSWHQASASILGTIDRIELTYSQSKPNIAYATSPGGSSVAQILRSEDGGKTWHSTQDPPGITENWFVAQGWHNNTLAVHPFRPDTLFVGGVYLRRAYIMGDSLRPAYAPTNMDRGGTEAWMELTDFGASSFDGTVSYLDPNAVDVTGADYSTIEIRFGQGSQKAHRFIVAEDAGYYGNGGSGIPFSEYQYADYVEVPLQVWDTDNNRQLMFSFRDQADNGVFNLIPYYTTVDPDTRDLQSREYIFIHYYDYDDTTPWSDIAQDGGLVNGLLYFLWPTLNPAATWDPSNLPAQTIEIEFATGTAFSRTVDDGIANDPPHVDHHVLQTIPIDEANQEFWIMNANDGGVAISRDGGESFTELDEPAAGYNTTQFYGVSKKPGEATYVAGTQDNGTWLSPADPDSRSGWDHVLGADGIETAWHATNPDLLMGTYQQTVVLVSRDAGLDWSISLDRYSFGGVFLTPLGTSDQAPDEVYTLSFDGAWRTLDFGLNWDFKPAGPNWGMWHGSTIRVSQADPTIVWIASGHDSRPDGRRIQVSTDRGDTFTSTALPNVAQPPEALASGLATHPTEPQAAYALFSVFGRAKILKTEDIGATWTDLSSFDAAGRSTNGFPDIPVYDLIVMPHAHNIMWAGTDIGLIRSVNHGASWSYANNGLPAVAVWRLKARDDQLILASHGRGVWTVPLAEITDVEEDSPSTLPSGFTLAQNYPNPFNASTNIQFEISSEVHVRIAVYDVVGRRVAILTDQVYAVGLHDLTWDASTHASGVYFYRMESGGQLIHTQKMTLLK